jgi:phospholipid/cholesterol/gamma-HCH transport system substrate-binding protein
MTLARERQARAAALVALALAVVAVVIVLTGGTTYVVHAQFTDAGQLVNGDLVTVAGHKVGLVGKIKLADNGLADVELDISDASITPLHEGTTAEIRQLSLTGVANRFVGLTPSSAGAKLSDGGTLRLDRTKGIVDLDVLLNALTPQVRASLQQIIRTGARFFEAPTAAQANEALRYFNPALSQATALGREVVADKFALERLIASTADVSTALAARTGDLGGAVTNTAAWLREVAGQRVALQDALVRAPSVLQQGTGVLRDVDFTLKLLNPALTALQPVAPRLATLLRKLVPAGRDAIPTIAGVQALVPSAEAALRALPPAEKLATPAVKSLTAALGPVTPILSGLRPYMPDLVAGFFNGVGGASGGYYDANGHYTRVAAVLQGGGASLTGALSVLGGLTGALGPLNGVRTGLLAPCPGGGSPPSPDGSTPFNNVDTLPGAGNLCHPADNQK